MCTSLSMVGRQHWKRGKRWGGLTVAVVVAAVATKEDAQVVHTGEQRRQHRPREIMNENGRAANTTACYLAATTYGFLSLSFSLSDTGQQLLSRVLFSEPRTPKPPSFVRAPEKAIRSYQHALLHRWLTVVRNEGHE